MHSHRAIAQPRISLFLTKLILFLFGTFFVAPVGFAAPEAEIKQASFWARRDSREIFVRVTTPPAPAGTLLFLNGLDRGMDTWDKMIGPLSARYRTIRVDMWGQGETLRRNGLSGSFEIPDLIADVKTAVNAVGIVGPLSVIGHSFGGGVAMTIAAQHTLPVQQLFLMAPFVPRLEEEEVIVGDVIRVSRQVFESVAPSAWWDVSIGLWFRSMVYFGANLNPGGFRTPLDIEAVCRLAAAIRTMPVYEVLPQIQARTHLIIAGGDYLVPRAAHERLWGKFPARAQGMELLMVGSSHYLPERADEASAITYLMTLVLENDPRLSGARQGVAYTTWAREAVFGQTHIPLPKRTGDISQTTN